jgi:putative Ca2+/H+ antiporter (TMEM165/GDT1 family)
MNFVAPLVLSTFGVVFVAELPDKTALASLILATRYPARQVVVGAWLAFLVQTAVAVTAGSVLAAFAGARLGRVLAPTLLSRASAALLAAMGVFVLVSAARP